MPKMHCFIDSNTVFASSRKLQSNDEYYTFFLWEKELTTLLLLHKQFQFYSSSDSSCLKTIRRFVLNLNQELLARGVCACHSTAASERFKNPCKISDWHQVRSKDTAGRFPLFFFVAKIKNMYQASTSTALWRNPSKIAVF